jgi:hypothetical protein
MSVYLHVEIRETLVFFCVVFVRTTIVVFRMGEERERETFKRKIRQASNSRSQRYSLSLFLFLSFRKKKYYLLFYLLLFNKYFQRLLYSYYDNGDQVKKVVLYTFIIIWPRPFRFLQLLPIT